jgi:BON domain
VTVRLLSPLAVACGLCLVGTLMAADTKKPSSGKPTSTKAAPAPQAKSGNQELANQIASTLQASRIAGGADISVSTQNGVVELTGRVRSTEQGSRIIEAVLSLPGVKEVSSQMKVVTDLELTQVSDTIPNRLPFGAPTPDLGGMLPTNPLLGGPLGGLPATPVSNGHSGAIPSDPQSLVPPAYSTIDQGGPAMPPYAWPTYAPYPNLSRVAYPQAYPYNAFPYIGPYYPFPKVPLGWRSVTLEWEDGHWYFGKRSTPHDYWRVRFW